MHEDIFDVKVYVANKEEPYEFKTSIRELHKKIYSANSNIEGWMPIHRNEKPAVEYSDGGYEWWLNGYLHNVNGPAIHYPSIDEYHYYINGVRMSKELFDVVKIQIHKKYDDNAVGWTRLDNCAVHIVNGVLHSDDGPAIVYDDGTQVWFDRGHLSRQEGPAIIWADGIKEYWFESKRVRCDWGFGPVVVSPNGSAIKWCIDGVDCNQQAYNDHIAQILKPQFGDDATFSVSILHDRICIRDADGQLHRSNGPAVMYFNGDKEWYYEGKLHRVGGPAVIKSDGTNIWYESGLRHREGGPAVEFANGRKVWYLEGTRIRKSHYKHKLADFKDKQELITAIESLLSEFSERIPQKNEDATTEEIQYLLEDLEQVESLFGGIMDSREKIIMGDKDKIIKHKKPVAIPDSIELLQEEVKVQPPTVSTEMGWEIPAISLAIAALLKLGKAARKNKYKKAASPKQITNITTSNQVVKQEEKVFEVVSHG